MTVRDLAKKLNIAEDVILTALKGMKLRAKDGDQELSAAVMGVVRGELEEKGLIPKQEVPKPVKKAAPKKKAVPAEKPIAEKPAKEAQPKSSKKKESAEVKKEAAVVEVPAQPEVKAPVKPKIVEQAKPQEIKPKESVGPKPQIVSYPEPRIVKLAPVRTGPVSVRYEDKPKLPDELSQFQAGLQAESAAQAGHGKKVILKVVKKVVPREQPAFVSVKPLAHGKRRSEHADRTEHHGVDHGHGAKADGSSDIQPSAPVVPKREGPLKDIELKVPLTVGEFSFKIQEKSNVVLKTLMGLGVFAHINQNMGEDIARKLALEFGFNLILVKSEEEQLVFEHEKDEEDPALMKPRAPVVTFMGHVDHGKTSLLDRIRKTKVVDSEHGGITQHIGAYSVAIDKGRITFLDTPGHAAFTAMRARGAHITDLVVVVIAADEGVMPQTKEAIDHARAANVPIVVALNKMDRPGADPDKVKKQLMEHGLLSEEWGGKTVVVPVSAVTGLGIDELLEMILLESEILELKANPLKKAAGIVVEAHLSPGKGALATLIVQSGSLKEGDILVVGPHYCRIKAMFNDLQRHIKEAGPSMPVEILGLPAVPEAGEKFFVVEEEKRAREITSLRQEKIKVDRLRSSSKITLEDLIAQKKEGEVSNLNILLKADVQGSAEALREALLKTPAESKEVSIKFIHVGVGDVNASDIILAHVSKAIIVAFGVGTNSDANVELQKTPVDVRRYNIIYDAVDDVRSALEGMLRPDTKRIFVARAEVIQVFNLTKSGLVAGCLIKKGRMRRGLEAEVFRNGLVVHKSRLSVLKRFKDDVKEVAEGTECGISVEGYDGYQAGDVIEVFQTEQIARKL